MVRVVKVFQAGRLDYQRALILQKILASRHHSLPKVSQDTLVLVEHNPIYTTGIRSKSYTEADEAKLKTLGAEFCRTNRGGLITFHGPGQLVAYPILDLRNFVPSVRWYVSHIEKTIIDVCDQLGLVAETSPHTGVWVKDMKICALGIHCSRYVTTHGLALNCNTDMNWFEHIVPCGIEGKGVTSLTRELKREFTIEDALPSFLLSFSKLFDCELCDFPKTDKDQILEQLCNHSTKR